MSEPTIVNDFERFWDPDYLNAFRLVMQRKVDRKTAIVEALRSLPTSRARVEACRDFEGNDRLIVLFTRDLNNDGARLNEAWLLIVLAEARAITWFGTEAAAGGFNLKPYRSLAKPTTIRATAESLLRNWMLDPIEYAGIASSEPIFLWGIEDRDLYVAGLSAYRGEGGSYFDIIARRLPIMVNNLLDKMNEMNVKVAGVCFTEYNYDGAQRILERMRIPYVAVRALNEGPTSYGRMEKSLLGKKWDDEEAFLDDLFRGRYEGFLGWFRSRRKRRSATLPAAAGRQDQVTISKTYWIDRCLERIRLHVSRVLKEFRPYPRSLSRVAEQLGVPIVPAVCDECAARFNAPRTSVAYPMIVEDMELDLGGYCRWCGRTFCPRHIQRIALKLQQEFYCLVGCPTCGLPLCAREGSEPAAPPTGLDSAVELRTTLRDLAQRC
jgi:hypothetical protein